MQYRLESITFATVPQRCGICDRKHRTVVKFSEVHIVVPEDVMQPVSIMSGAGLTTGPRCAYKLLGQVPMAFLGFARRQLELLREK